MTPFVILFRVDTVPDLTDFSVQSGTRAFQLGWENSGGPLGKISLEIISDEQCAVEYGNNQAIISSMICGNEFYDCLSESGSPLMCEADQNSLCGIASWAYGCATYPAVFTEIYEFREWIFDKINAI